MYLSIKAPCCTKTSVAIRKNASTTSWVLSAPRSWVSSVKDDRSANSTVISASRPSSIWVPQRVQILGFRELRFMPTVRNTTLIAPDKSVPQTRHCAERLEAAGVLMTDGNELLSKCDYLAQTEQK